MSASPLITTYLGSGLLASRPATPSIPTNGLAVWRSTDTGTTSVYDTAWHDLGTGGGGGSTNPTVRAAGSYLSSSLSSYNMPLPTGSLSGDTIFIFAAGSYNWSTPTGFTILDSASGGSWNGITCWKVLTSGDISTGYITVAQSSSGRGAIHAIVFKSGCTVRTHIMTHGNTSDNYGITLTSDSTPTTADTAIMFASANLKSPGFITLGTPILALQTTDYHVTQTNEITPLNNDVIQATAWWPNNASSGYYVSMVVVKQP